MQIGDITIEVRDAALERVGVILPQDLVGFKAVMRFNNVGSWELQLPDSHEVGSSLREPGSGIIVNGPNGVLMSGPMTSAVKSQSNNDPEGTWTIQGVDDTVILGERLAYPTPTSADVTMQTNAYDSRSGIASSVIYAYVDANIGPSAPVEREIPGLSLATDTLLGGTVYAQARFDVLGELLSGLASVDGLGFDIRQQDGTLEFSVFQPVDRSGYIRMDVENNTLAKSEYGYGTHARSRAIVAGEGAGAARVFTEVTTTESLGAETLWGRRIETFIDKSNTADVNELTQAGLESLADGGATLTSVDVVPSNDLTMEFGTDWGLGDRVTVVVGGQEVSAIVTTAALTIEDDGVRIGATVGEPTGVDFEALTTKRQTKQAQRINALERKEGGGSGGGPASNVEITVKNKTGSTLLKGQAVYIVSSDGENLNVQLAKANAESTSSKTLGLLKQDLANGEIGLVITEGFLDDVNTQGLTAGDPMWLSPTTAGGIVFGLANKPTAPNHMVFLGYVLRVQQNNGGYYVKVQNGFENDELHDRLTYVSSTAPADGKDYYYWLDNTTGRIYFRYNDGDSSQWIELKSSSGSDVTSRVSTAEANINSLTSRTTALETTSTSYGSRITALEPAVTNVKSGYYVRQIFTEIDTTSRTAGTGMTLGPTFASRTYKANSIIKMSYHVPMRNDASGWGGIYIEPQVAINGTWYSLGTTGHEMMHLGNADIATYKNDLVLNFGQTADFTAQFRFYFRAYEGTVGWNNGSNHDINASGTGTQLWAGDNSNQHYMHMIIEEFAKA